jgi:hypothetical protein
MVMLQASHSLAIKRKASSTVAIRMLIVHGTPASSTVAHVMPTGAATTRASLSGMPAGDWITPNPMLFSSYV